MKQIRGVTLKLLRKLHQTTAKITHGFRGTLALQHVRCGDYGTGELRSRRRMHSLAAGRCWSAGDA